MVWTNAIIQLCQQEWGNHSQSHRVMKTVINLENQLNVGISECHSARGDWLFTATISAECLYTWRIFQCPDLSLYVSSIRARLRSNEYISQTVPESCRSNLNAREVFARYPARWSILNARVSVKQYISLHKNNRSWSILLIYSIHKTVSPE